MNSSLRVTWLELAAAIVAATLALIYLWIFLSIETSRAGLQVFTVFILPVELFMIPSAISLIRSISRDDGQLSRLGFFALGWPALSVFLLHPMYYLFVPLGVGLTFLAIASPRRRLPGDFLPFLWNTAWFGLAIIFSTAIWIAFGD
jgi:hypothetical protein